MTIAPCTDDGHNAPPWLRITSPKCGAGIVEWKGEDEKAIEDRKAERAAANELQREAKRIKREAEAFERRKLFAETQIREKTERALIAAKNCEENKTKNAKRTLQRMNERRRAKRASDRLAKGNPERKRRSAASLRPSGCLTMAESVEYLRGCYKFGSSNVICVAASEGRLKVVRVSHYVYATREALDTYAILRFESKRQSMARSNKIRLGKSWNI